MTCGKCQVQITFNFLDDEIKLLTAKKIRVRRMYVFCD